MSQFPINIDTYSFRQACIHSVCGSVRELCDEIEAWKRILKTHIFVKFVNESTLAIWLEESL